MSLKVGPSAAVQEGMDLVDLHCHVLPEVDDGPGAMPDAVAMVQALGQDGVATVVATPHLRDDHPDVRPLELAGRCLELEGRAAAAGASVAIEPGGELDLEWALEAAPADLRRVSIGGTGDVLLVETRSDRCAWTSRSEWPRSCGPATGSSSLIPR